MFQRSSRAVRTLLRLLYRFSINKGGPVRGRRFHEVDRLAAPQQPHDIRERELTPVRGWIRPIDGLGRRDR